MRRGDQWADEHDDDLRTCVTCSLRALAEYAKALRLARHCGGVDLKTFP